MGSELGFKIRVNWTLKIIKMKSQLYRTGRTLDKIDACPGISGKRLQGGGNFCDKSKIKSAQRLE